MTTRISQATLNTYLDYEDSNNQTRTSGTNGNSSTFVPARYARQSELRFVSGPSSTLLASGSGQYFTHSIFFQAPLGEADNTGRCGGLQYLLNTRGYYIEYCSDVDFRPPFLATLAEKKRFRLMEFIQPSENMNLYRFTSGTSGSSTYNGYDWFVKTDRSVGDKVISTGTSSPAHVLADNIIALVLLPMLTPEEDYTGTALAANYLYDSTIRTNDATINPRNQLPPIVQMTMVAIDEASAGRMTETDCINLQNKIEQSASGVRFATANQFNADLKRDATTYPNIGIDPSLEAYLISKRINYRIFTTNVSIKGAKWSRAQSK